MTQFLKPKLNTLKRPRLRLKNTRIRQLRSLRMIDQLKGLKLHKLSDQTKFVYYFPNY